MKIDPEVCTGCGSCMVYCPVEAIVETDRKTPKRKAIRAVDLDRCVECGNCLRADVCPVDAIVQQPLDWPRSLRSAFSNPMTEHKSKDMGRGTEEMKTNEITHRIGKGEVGVAIELGRPLLGSSFRDVERVTRAMAGVGVTFEPHNPLTSLIEDLSTGTLRKDVLDERVLSTIVEFKIPEEKSGRRSAGNQGRGGSHRVRLLPGHHCRAAPRGPAPCSRTDQEAWLRRQAQRQSQPGIGQAHPRRFPARPG